jgi:hypothetical protein
MQIVDCLTERPPALLGRLLFGLCLASIVCHPARSQGMVEAAGTSSISSATVTSAKSSSIPAVPPSTNHSASPHVFLTPGPSPEETNRRALEENAGAGASKLLLRSSLPDSRVWINGKPIGKLPMLVVVPPGKYQVELVGPHAERTECSVALLPRETRELNLKLVPRYPARVTAH